MSIDNRLAVLSLIACDDSYWSSWPAGDPLVTRPDSKAVNGDLEPDPIPEHLMHSAGLQFTYLFKGAYRIEGWKVAASITNSATGFGVVVFQNDAKTEAIVAFTGTNGFTPQGLQGWYTDLTLARTQWSDAISEAVMAGIGRLEGPAGGPGSFTGTINFTGQSLGGALAQYALYDYASTAPGFDAIRVTLTTFNALGVIDALSGRADFELITDLVADVQTAHYTTYNDIVHRLGGGYLNGSGNTYQFRFTRTVPGYDYYDDAGNLYRIPAREVAYDFVDAHRIESGFYRGFTKTGSDFASAKPYTPSLISAEAARTIADGFGNLLNDRDHYPAESFSRLVAGITASVAINPIAARELAYELLHSMKLQATTIPSRAIWRAFETVVPLGLQIAHLHPLSRVPLLGAATYALAIAAALDAGEEIGQGAASLREYLIDAVENARVRSPGNIADFEFASSFIDDTSLIEQQTKALAAMALASSSLPGLTAEWAAVLIDDMRAVMEVFHSENWAPDLLRYVTKRIYEANAPAGASPDQIGRSVGEALGVVSKGIYTLGAQTLDASVDAAAALQDLAQNLQHGVVSVARALSNAYGQLTLKFADAFDWGTAVSRQTVNATLQGLVASAKVDVDRVGPSLDDAISTLELAAQIVVVRPGREQNPFDDEAFEPDALPVSTGALQEGRVSTFSLYLPYEAGVGGQRVRLELEGAGAEDLSVLAAGEQIELEAGGTFTVTVAEGQREASFSIVADADLDADATLTLRATLVNAAGEATHLEHEEATIALDSEMESAPTGGREIRGDWAPKPYDDGFGVYYKIDDLWNYERLPGVPNTMGIGEPDHVLQGSSGSDHIVAADQLLEVIYADAGDDVLTDNENWWMYANGGAGDDWIEALGYAYQASDQFEWEYFGRTIKRGEDKIYGGAGNDQIYGESAATVDSLYDPSVTPTGLLGDWTSGGSGADRIYGGTGDDVLMGGTGEDRLVGGAGKDVLLGDDHYIVRPESNLWTVVHPNFGDFTSGFGGFEVGLFPVVNATSVSPDFISAPTGDPDFMYYKFGGAADVLIGGAGDDILIGQAGDDVAYGGDHNDILAGWEGADALYGGSGDDRIAGDFGGYEQVNQRGMQAPQLVGPGVLGSPGAYGTAVDQAGADFLDGGGGNDVLHGEGGNDVVLGGDGADVLFGDATYLPAELHGDDLLDGGAGSDQLFGGGGEDKLYGGDGDDILSGGAGNDLLEGGAGSDSLDAGEGDDMLQAGAGSDTLSGGAGADELHAGAGDDGLDGGEGHDVLHGDGGADRLEGGAGNDTLFGGSGDDLVDGGDGDDVIDGGAGADILRGGEGNDTYWVGSGYGRELIEDSHGENRIRFGPGILPEVLAAELDPATLAVTLSFGAGDAVSLNLGQVEIGGVDFSNGTAWTRSRLIDFLPAVASQGSGASDALVGNPRLRNELRGEAGDDILQGASYADYLAGGDGNDSLDGKSGSDRYFFAADESGVDLLADSGVAARAYLDWFYQSRGIADWAERANRGGQYRVQGERNDDRGQFVEYFDTYEEAYEEHPFATIFYVEPLPELAPLVTRNNAEALAELSGAGVLDEDFVEFGAGLGLSDLELTLAVPASFANEYPEQPWYGGGHLSVRWGAAGFDVQIPGVAYGFAGSDLLGSSQDDDEENEDGSWRGYRLGEGVEAFHFADGSSYTLEQILQQAVVVPGHVLLRGSGEQIIDRRSPEVVFEPGIEVADVAITREGVDLVLRLNDFSASGRIEGWFADPANMPDIGLRFADGASISAPQVTEIALTQQGSPFDDVLQSIDSFPNRLHGMGGNDVLHGADGEDLLEGSEGDDHLDGGAGKDTYVFNQGDGIDTITDEPSGADDASVIVFGPDIHAWQIRPGLGSLVLNYGASDAIHFSAFDPDDPYTAPAFERLEFHDGSSLAYQQVLGLGFQLFGSEDDDVISATGLDDFIDGAAGNDTLDGRGGADIVVGGDGDDTLAGGAGDGDFVDGGDGSDTYIYAFGDGYDQIADWDEALDDVDVLRLTGGILPADVRITRDDWSYHLVLGTADRVVLDSMAREPVAEIERIEFDEGTVWTATDLASRVELLPGTERGDMLWGSAGADSIEGLAGDDSLFGNAGDDFLAGGEGSDFYYFGAGDGADVVDNADTDGSFDSIFFAEASSTYARVAKSGEDLVIRIGSGSDRVTLLGWYSDFNRKIDDVSFAGDGAFWDAATLEALAPREGGNSAPELSIPIADQEATEDAAFNFTVPEHTFRDPDAGDTLHYSASELPAWLSFDAGTRTFSGTPANADVDSYEIKVTATDTFGERASHTFWVEVLNTNDAPVVGAALLEHFGREGEPLNFTLPSDAFIDVDTGDSLTLAANLADGAPLPDWLAFENGTFDGTPRRADRGEYLIQITAIDAAGASVSANFGLAVSDSLARGNRLVGTRRNDVLNGTNADEFLVGRAGSDHLLGGAGDDVLSGGRGNDKLSGGLGQDVYIHSPRGGHDKIDEAGAAGEMDVLRLGEGIKRNMVRASRHRDDLVLDLSGPHGSVTVKDWFRSSAQRVERIEFADGTSWDEKAIRKAVRHWYDDDCHEPARHDAYRDERSNYVADERRGRRDDQPAQDGAAISGRLSRSLSFDFEALARELERTGKQEKPLTPQQIRRQWAAVQRYVSALALEGEQDDASLAGWRDFSAASLLGANGFGFEASVGAARGPENLNSLEGLSEGFRRL